MIEEELLQSLAIGHIKPAIGHNKTEAAAFAQEFGAMDKKVGVQSRAAVEHRMCGIPAGGQSAGEAIPVVKNGQLGNSLIGLIEAVYPFSAGIRGITDDGVEKVVAERTIGARLQAKEIRLDDLSLG